MWVEVSVNYEQVLIDFYDKNNRFGCFQDGKDARQRIIRPEPVSAIAV